MAAKFPTRQDHYNAIQYASSYGTENNEVPEPDWDNTAGGISLNRYFNNPSTMPPRMQSKYLYYLQRTQQAAKVIKF